MSSWPPPDVPTRHLLLGLAGARCRGTHDRSVRNLHSCVLLQNNCFVGSARQPELVQRMIQEVRSLNPELQLLAFCDLEVLIDTQVTVK